MARSMPLRGDPAPLGRPLPPLVAACIILACGSSGRGTRAPEGPATRMQADAYVSRAIRSSNEGFILFPSVRAERVYDRAELQRIAQDLRPRAAACFLRRTIETIRGVETENGVRYEGAPEGQAKIRVRVGPDGSTLRAEILESAFSDEAMERCLTGLLERVHWPPNRQGHTHYIDVVYWVSLGMNRLAHTEEMRKALRREQAAAAVRGKKCIRGRVEPGRYEITGTNLADRDGRTVASRLEPNDLPPDAARCLVRALETIRIPRDPEAFVRPFPVRVGFSVTPDGRVTADDERWLDLLRREEAARARARRAERAGLDLGGRMPGAPTPPPSAVHGERSPPAHQNVASGGAPSTGRGPVGAPARTEAPHATPGSASEEPAPPRRSAPPAAETRTGPLPLSGLRDARRPRRPPGG